MKNFIAIFAAGMLGLTATATATAAYAEGEGNGDPFPFHAGGIATATATPGRTGAALRASGLADEASQKVGVRPLRPWPER
jgi:hypothetical protein